MNVKVEEKVQSKRKGTEILGGWK